MLADGARIAPVCDGGRQHTQILDVAGCLRPLARPGMRQPSFLHRNRRLRGVTRRGGDDRGRAYLSAPPSPFSRSLSEKLTRGAAMVGRATPVNGG